MRMQEMEFRCMFLESFSTVKSNSLKSLLLTSLSVSFGADGFWTKLRSASERINVEYWKRVALA